MIRYLNSKSLVDESFLKELLMYLDEKLTYLKENEISN